MVKRFGIAMVLALTSMSYAQREVKLKPNATYRVDALFRAQSKGANITIPRGKTVNLLLPKEGSHLLLGPSHLTREAQGAALLRGGPLEKLVAGQKSARGKVVHGVRSNTLVQFREDYYTGFGRESQRHTGDNFDIGER